MVLTIKSLGREAAGIAIAMALAIAPGKLWAQQAPPAHIASPEIYRVLFETDLMRVLLATWQPGQRDAWHSHPPTSVFYITDCHARVFLADGSQLELKRKAKTGRARDEPVISHSFQNIGDSVCQMQFTELKNTN
jgi:quercetin dioxygenase-like cupin family protein